jgi:hypothetical protein
MASYYARKINHKGHKEHKEIIEQEQAEQNRELFFDLCSSLLTLLPPVKNLFVFPLRALCGLCGSVFSL